MKRLLASLILLLACALAERPCDAAEPVVVLLHSRGSVFDQAADGFRHNRTPVLDLVVDASAPMDGLVDKVRNAHPDVLVAIGPDAARFAGERFQDLPRVVALCPSVEAPRGAPVAMVASEIPPAVQMRWIAEVLPDVQVIGIVYNPRSTQDRVDEFSAAAAIGRARSRKLTIVPIPVGTESDVPSAFREKLSGIQALLFVNDATVMTKDTILYLLKESVAAGIPAIGFNWYFVDNGAVLAFGPDYDAVGRQSADAVGRLLEDRNGSIVAPSKPTVWVNSRVAQKLRIRTSYDPDDVREIR